jgi:two-component system LytT family sensor kinase
MEYFKLTRKEIKSHIIVWIACLIFFVLFTPAFTTLGFMIFLNVCFIINYAFVYYSLSFFIFPKFYKKENKANLILFISLLLLIYWGLIYIKLFYFPYLWGIQGLFKSSLYSYYSQYTVFFCIILSIALGTYQNKLALSNLKKQNEKEIILITNNLGFLKNQFNSHILFNFLSYCYAFAQKSSSEASEAIELFSSMLRHTLDCKPDQMVPLTKEINYISDFISLQKTINPNIHVKFEVMGDITKKNVFPRILITFIENAFKHGDIESEHNPILIYLNSSVNSIELKVKNKKRTTKNDIISTGIGYQNVKQQLALFYEGRYKLETVNDEEFYECKLLIKV